MIDKERIETTISDLPGAIFGNVVGILAKFQNNYKALYGEEIIKDYQTSLMIECLYLSVEIIVSRVQNKFNQTELSYFAQELHRRIVNLLNDIYFTEDNNPPGYEEKTKKMYHECLNERKALLEKHDMKELFILRLESWSQEQKLNIRKELLTQLYEHILEAINNIELI